MKWNEMKWNEMSTKGQGAKGKGQREREKLVPKKESTLNCCLKNMS